jgi:DNA-binding transcriptional LysR family regulator
MGSPVPYLGYAPGSFLCRAVDYVIEQNDTRPVLGLRYQNALADSLKSMAAARHGLAWLPESLVEADLARKSLLRAGGAEWELPLEIRLYKARTSSRSEAVALWSSL